MERRIEKDEMEARCKEAWTALGERGSMSPGELILILKATQGVSDYVCNEIVNPVSKEKMPFLILSLRQLIESLEESYPVDAMMASMLGGFIGSRRAKAGESAPDAEAILSDAMRAMNGDRDEAEK